MQFLALLVHHNRVWKRTSYCLHYYLGGYLPGIGGIFNMILILLILLIRPHGLLGAKPIERV